MADRKSTPEQRQTITALSCIGVPIAEWKPGIYDTLHQFIECAPETERQGTLVCLSDGSLQFYDA